MKEDQLIYIKANLDEYNRILRNKEPEDIIKFMLSVATRPILTSNFGPYSASLIHAVSIRKPGIPLIWCDTGYNTEQTRNFAKNLDRRLPFNLKMCKPLDHNYQDRIPNQNEILFQDFVRKVKLEPFQQALNEHRPDIWFTNIRRGQTAYRDSLNILSLNNQGILKVSPFYFWSDTQLQGYLRQHELPNEFVYYDPTKPKSNLECGIQL